MVKAVLFDLDGTLADTLCDLADAANAVLTAHGLPVHPLNAYRRFVGDGAKVLVQRASGITDDERLAPLYEAFIGEYDRRCLSKVCAYDGAFETLDMLKTAGLTLGVVTNKPHAQAVKLVSRLFGERFGCVFGGQTVYPKKPDPQSLYLACESLGVSPSECVFVGDSDVDVKAAHAAGMPCIGCCYGFRGEAELTVAGADALVYSFADLQKNRLIFA